MATRACFETRPYGPLLSMTPIVDSTDRVMLRSREAASRSTLAGRLS